MQNYEAKKPSYFATPSPQLVRALHTALAQIVAQGVKERFAAHKAASDKIKKGIAALGLKQVAANPDDQAHGMTAIYLPETVSGGNRMEQEKAVHQAIHQPTGTERVLFVDDEAALASLAENMLGMLGYKVTAKTSSMDALALFREDPEGFDLVITDLTMPGMTGDRLAAELMRIRHDIPIIICTGYSDYFTANDARDLGIREYLQKPLSLMTLAGTVRKVLALE